jgi:hypothetical protein
MKYKLIIYGYNKNQSLELDNTVFFCDLNDTTAKFTAIKLYKTIYPYILKKDMCLLLYRDGEKRSFFEV